MSGCTQCGMWVDPKKPYHPYAACLMFMGCKDGNTVQANLDAVVAYGGLQEQRLAKETPAEACRAIAISSDPDFKCVHCGQPNSAHLHQSRAASTKGDGT